MTTACPEEAYRTLREAKRAAWRHRSRGETAQTAHCDHCDQWHVQTEPQP